MEREWTSWMQSASQLPTGRVKEASTAQVCDWILRSWNGVKKEAVVKLFKKCGISNAMGGNENSEIYWDEKSDSSENIGNAEIEDDDTSDIDSDEEFLAFYDAQIL